MLSVVLLVFAGLTYPNTPTDPDPTLTPIPSPTADTTTPTLTPTPPPTQKPTQKPTPIPTAAPTLSPTSQPPTPTPTASPSPTPEMNQSERAINYLTNVMFVPSLALEKASPITEPNTIWLTNDNILASAVLLKFNQTMALTINQSLAKYGVSGNGLVELALNKTIEPIRGSNSYDVAQVEQYTIKVDVRDGDIMLDFTQYADLCFWWAQNLLLKNDTAGSITYFNQGLSMWNHTGFLDFPFNDTGQKEFQTFKVGLALWMAERLNYTTNGQLYQQTSFTNADYIEMQNIIWSLQDLTNGGIHTGYSSTSGMISSNTDTNVETTSICLLYQLVPPPTTAQTTSTMRAGVLAHNLTDAQAAVLAESGINWIRGDVTSNNDYGWNNIYELAKTYNLSLIGTLDHITMNQQAFNLADWEHTVNASVADYGDVVHVWEIWNEPFFEDNYLSCFNGSAEAYFELLKTAYTIIKANDPSDIVLGLGGLPLYSSTDGPPDSNITYVEYSINFTKQLWSMGAQNYCDAISLHAYPYGNYTKEHAETSFNKTLAFYQNITGKPIWITETGQYSRQENTTFTELDQADYLSASYQLFKEHKVEAYIWYELSDDPLYPEYTFGLYNTDLTTKEALNRYIQLVNNG